MRSEAERPKLNLTGKDGNAMSIVGSAVAVAMNAGWSEEKRQQFTDEALSGDYDHLLRTCQKYFDCN